LLRAHLSTGVHLNGLHPVTVGACRWRSQFTLPPSSTAEGSCAPADSEPCRLRGAAIASRAFRCDGAVICTLPIQSRKSEPHGHLMALRCANQAIVS
jgi:hypothetical protein